MSQVKLDGFCENCPYAKITVERYKEYSGPNITYMFEAICKYEDICNRMWSVALDSIRNHYRTADQSCS